MGLRLKALRERGCVLGGQLESRLDDDDIFMWHFHCVEPFKVLRANEPVNKLNGGLVWFRCHNDMITATVLALQNKQLKVAPTHIIVHEWLYFRG